LLYQLTADLLLLIHLAFIVFVVMGGFFVLKWPRLALLHLPAVVWGAIVEIKGLLCPLTPWENSLRHMAGQEGYSEGFIEYYLIPLIYPAELTRDLQITMGLIVVAINLSIYSYIVYRLIRKNKEG